MGKDRSVGCRSIHESRPAAPREIFVGSSRELSSGRRIATAQRTGHLKLWVAGAHDESECESFSAPPGRNVGLPFAEVALCLLSTGCPATWQGFHSAYNPSM